MTWWQRLWRGKQLEQQLDQELRFHLDKHVSDLVAQGHDPAEARRLARLAIGGTEQVKEKCRDARGTRWLEDLAEDLRYGLRMLRKNPGFTAVAVATLALGIGANTAIFSVIESLLLRPLPVKDPTQLTVLALRQGQGPLANAFSIPDMNDLRSQASAVFSDVAGYQAGTEGMSVNGTAQPVLIDYVTGNFFSSVGIRARLGRLILPLEGNVAGADPVLVLSYSYWKLRFGGDPQIIGKTVAINGTPVTIVGVAPEGFHGPYCLTDTQAYLPLGMLTVETWWRTHDFLHKRALRNTALLARLRTGVSFRGAQAALNVLGPRLAKQFPKDDQEMTLLVFPEQLSRPNPDPTGKVQEIAWLFLILGGLVLLLACVNIANILLVRATSRRREWAVRAALGAGRARLARQSLTESVLLALTAGVVGAVCGVWGARSLNLLNLHGDLPIYLAVLFDWRVFAYALFAALLTGALVGVAPALMIFRTNLAGTLHEGGRTMAGARNRARTAAVVFEIAGSLALLIAAGLFTRGLRNAQRAELGFDPHQVVNLTLDPHEIGYDQAQGLEFDKQLLERVRAMAGVESASMASSVPMGYVTSNDNLQIPGYAIPPGEAPPLANDVFVMPDYFKTLGIPLLEGRDFAATDDERSQAVAIINLTMAQRFWPGLDPIGRTFTFGSGTLVTAQVIGVVKDSRLLGLQGPIDPAFYAPLAQTYLSLETLQVRTAPAPESMIAPLRRTIEQTAPEMPVLKAESMMQAMGTLQGFLMFELGAGLAWVLGTLGLVLAVVGIYGVVSYSASQRTREIGIRLALGAQKRQVLELILGHTLAIVSIGILAGILAAVAIARLVGGLLIGVAPMDPLTYVSASLLLASVALLASYLPARRASRMDPMVALRQE